MALPEFKIQDLSVQLNRQQCRTVPTAEAYKAQNKDGAFPKPSTRLLDERTAAEEAKRKLQQSGYVNPTRQQYMGALVLPFGKYRHASFKWLLENDVGYVKYLVNTHVKERAKCGMNKTLNDGWLKDLLTEYCEFFPQVYTLLENHVAECIYGHAPFKSHNFEEMWQLYTRYKTKYLNAGIDPLKQPDDEDIIKLQRAYASVKGWTTMSMPSIKSKVMKRFKQFIEDKEAKQELAAVRAVEHPSIPASQAPAAHPTRTELTRQQVLTGSVLRTTEISRPSSSATQRAPLEAKQELAAVRAVEHPSIPASQAPAAHPTRTELTRQQALTGSVLRATEISRPSSSATQRAPLEATTARASLIIRAEAQAGPELEGWSQVWEDKQKGLPAADINWLKYDRERGLFGETRSYKDANENLKQKRILREAMWFYPPDIPGMTKSTVPGPDAFFRHRVFFWRPVGLWRYSILCPRPDCPGGGKEILHRNGYSTSVRYICDVNEWYCMLSECLSCNACTKAARSKEGKFSRHLSWEDSIMKQLSPAHQEAFPAVLTKRRGVDKKVVRLLTDRTEGNTMKKVWRQLKENHDSEHLRRLDMYTTLLTKLKKPGSIASSMVTTFTPPPPQRQLPDCRLLRTAYLLREAEMMVEHRRQILSTFGSILKMDSTKKVIKKLSGDGKGTAEWFTSISNSNSQILSFVLTTGESYNELEAMVKGLMDRYQKANQPAPEVLYIDRGCCRSLGGHSLLERLFDAWVDKGMTIRLDIYHWIHRFASAVRTESHQKYGLFMSCLSGAVMAYNRSDLDLVVKSTRQGDPNKFSRVSDTEVLKRVSSETIMNYVRRVTIGVQETFDRVEALIAEMKGPAGLDSNGVALFKTNEAIDSVWAAQQKHLECLQDPPGISLYNVVKISTKNGVEMPRYRCLRGSNSLEGFHKFLPEMIPGPHCASKPYQVYLMSGIARWNSDRQSDCVIGQKGQRFKVYNAPLIDRLNNRCRELFGEEYVPEPNFHRAARLTEERLGLEYLFHQSTGEFQAIAESIREEEDDDQEIEVQDEGRWDSGVEDNEEDVNLSPVINPEDVMIPGRSAITQNDVAPELDPAMEDVCSSNPLPGFEKVDNLAILLLQLGKESTLTTNVTQRQSILDAWNALEEYDKRPSRFASFYKSHWGNTLYGRTKGTDVNDAGITQRIKISNHYAPAHTIDLQVNRLCYAIINQLWLQCHSTKSPHEKVLQEYARIQHKILVEDSALSTLGIPLQKINKKSLRDFLRRREYLLTQRTTVQARGLITRMESVTADPMPEAPKLPEILSQPLWEPVAYLHKECRAGEKILKSRVSVPEATTTRFHNPIPLLLPSQRIAIVSNQANSGIPSSESERTQSAAPKRTAHVPSSESQSSAPKQTAHVPSSGLQSSTLKRTAPNEEADASNRPQWARSTLYKKMKVDPRIEMDPKFPLCTLCGKSTQGHRKYRRKTYCSESRRSSSKGLKGKVFDSYDDFVNAVNNIDTLD